jgi:peptide/nickel transport system substrate-binding protein
MGEVNYGGYSNPTLDDLIGRIGIETDQEKRDGMIHDAALILQHELPTIPLHQQVIVWAAKENVELVQQPTNAFPYRYVTVK